MDIASRELVRQRAGRRCEYCQIHEDDELFAFHLEHVVPRKHGGSEEILSKLARITFVESKSSNTQNPYMWRDQAWLQDMVQASQKCFDYLLQPFFVSSNPSNSRPAFAPASVSSR